MAYERNYKLGKRDEIEAANDLRKAYSSIRGLIHPIANIGCIEYAAVNWLTNMFDWDVMEHYVTENALKKEFFWIDAPERDEIIQTFDIKVGQSWLEVVGKILASVVDYNGYAVVDAERRGDEWMHEYNSLYATLAGILNYGL